MDTQRDSAALEETEEIRPNENSAEAIGPDEITQAGEEWPVAREYRVASDENGGIPPPADEAGEMVVASPPRSRRLPLYIGGGLLAALLALLLVLGAAWLMSRGDDSKQAQRTVPAAPSKPTKSTKAAPVSVAVPDVSGLEVTRARSVLEDAGLRVQIREATSASDTASPGEVLRQTPAAGTDIAAGTAVVLTVPGAQPRIQVPAVIGLKVSDATHALQDAGLRADVRLVRSAKPAGTVLDQTPTAGTELAAKDAVRLEVAKASPPVTIAVPRLVGSTAAEAKSQLRSLGLRWTTTPVESPKLEGTVVAQSPSVGTRLRKGQSVTLEVSTGPTQVTIPDVIGLDEQSARAQLEAAGFAVQVTNEVTTDPGQDGMVISQAPVGGSKGDTAGTVTLTVGRLG
jgi:beta-lactam-binding protein with PASTA domain